MPNPSWVNFVVTAKARSAIRHYLKSLRRTEAIGLGQRLVDRGGRLGLLACGRLMAERQRSERHLLDHLAADAVGQDAVVIARDPDPVAALLHLG